MSADSASDVSGPVATMTGASRRRGNRRTSSRTIVMSGCVPMASVTISANRSRSTASAAPGRHAAGLRGPHDERAEPAHFFLQEPDGVVEFVAAEGIAAHELGEAIGLVDGGRPHRPHFVER
jgi:hypothetical protein